MTKSSISAATRSGLPSWGKCPAGSTSRRECGISAATARACTRGTTGPVEEDVRRLRQRIFKASQAGDLKRIFNLQKLMLRSRSNTLVSVRRVTQHNAGRKTAGIDGEVALTSPDRAASGQCKRIPLER